jgi:hypothetical protein
MELAQAFGDARLGWVGLDSRGQGRKLKLSGEQKQALYTMVKAGPQVQGLEWGYGPRR